MPFYVIDYEKTGFRAKLEGRSYVALDRDDRFVLAGRATFGSILGDPREEIPTPLLFFSGGGGSVRGYQFRANGVEIDGETFGGRGLLELSAELRAKVTEDIGVVAFSDTGWVSEGSWALDDDDPRTGVGFGLRYQTGLGPIRLDIAAPVDRQPGEDSFAFYLGIGQSF